MVDLDVEAKVESRTAVITSVDQAEVVHALGSGMQLGELCDVLAHSLKLPPEDAQRLLAQADVDLRSDQVLEMLKTQFRGTLEPVGRDFPPGFSLN